MSLETMPVMNSENNRPLTQTQDKHIEQFNNSGKIMASLADYYAAGKSGDETIISSLRKDFSESWIVGSDRIIYASDSLDAKIISYYGSNVTTPFERDVTIPVYNGKILDLVLGTEQGLTYIQTLFNTLDTADEIKQTLYALSGISSNQTKVWTLDQNSRKSNPNRAAFLGYFNVDYFLVDGNISLLNIDGRSRGVLDSPEGAAHDNSVLSSNKDNNDFPLEKGIDITNRCVYLSTEQEIKNYSKYSGVFFFHNRRFVFSMTTPKLDEDSIDNKIASILSTGKSTQEKLGIIEQTYNPIYAHLQKYENFDNEFILADDSESFIEPRIVEVKQ